MNKSHSVRSFPFALLLLLFLSSVSLLVACQAKKSATGGFNSQDYVAKGYVKATVVLYDVDGCKWMLQLEDGKKLNPGGKLSESFCVNGLAVWIKYQIQKGAVSTCMSGEGIFLNGIEKRN